MDRRRRAGQRRRCHQGDPPRPGHRAHPCGDRRVPRRTALSAGDHSRSDEVIAWSTNGKEIVKTGYTPARRLAGGSRGGGRPRRSRHAGVPTSLGSPRRAWPRPACRDAGHGPLSPREGHGRGRHAGCRPRPRLVRTWWRAAGGSLMVWSRNGKEIVKMGHILLAVRGAGSPLSG